MIRRNTIQKELVLESVNELKSHVSADEVYSYLLLKQPTISRGTVYRNLNILSDEGRIKKIKTPEGADVYDFMLHEHCHIRCISCGNIYDIDIQDFPDILSQVKAKNGFEIHSCNIFFEGLCPGCIEQTKAC